VAALGRVRSVSTGTADRIDAERIHAELLAAAAGRMTRERWDRFLVEATQARAVERVGIGEAWARYADLPESRRLSGRELAIRGQRWGAFVDWAKGRGIGALGDVTTRDALAWWDALRGGTRTGKTCNHYRATCVSVWQGLRERLGLGACPWSAIKAAGEEDSQSGRALSAAEVAALLAVAPWPYSGAMVASLYTGLRLTDLLGLDWGAIDGEWLLITPSKTARHGVRVRIPIHPAFGAVLVRARGETGGAGLVWPGLRLQLRCDRNRRRQFEYLAELAGVGAGENLTFHCLRHTFRTRLAAAGVGQDVAMRLGGWRSAAMADHYNHDENSLRRAISAL
jgi:integrase